MKIDEYLRNLIYPGRIIVCGSFSDGRPLFAYVLMGRSKESRERRIAKSANILKVEMVDGSAGDPLREYSMSITLGLKRIIGNGTHTDRIKEGLDRGESLETILSDIDYENDKYKTPRIAAVYSLDSGSYTICISKESEKALWEYPKMNGYAHLIQTYVGDGGLSSFEDDPVLIEVPKDIEELKEEIWESLNRENRVTLYLSDGFDEFIINRALDD